MISALIVSCGPQLVEVLICFRSGNLVAVRSLKTPWRRRQLERAEKKALKEYEAELKEAAQRQKEVGIERTFRHLPHHSVIRSERRR